MSKRIFVCDFETTVFEGQTNTEVWASAFVELFTDNVVIHHSIVETMLYFFNLQSSLTLYYHNLKFDGSFILDFLLVKLKMQQAFYIISQDPYKVKWLSTKDMPNNSFKYSISDMGQWYTITIKVNNHIIEIRDSYKILPFSVERIGKSFGTKHKKLDMEYKGYRFAGCEITEEEKSYIKNDVLVVKEGLEIMYDDGHDKLTIGSCCLQEFRNNFDRIDWNNHFPNVYDLQLDTKKYVQENVGEYIRKSYKGGWCYVVKGKQSKLFTKGITADVNSLYPSEMHSMSGNKYPFGKPKFWCGNYIPNICFDERIYYFIRIKTRFYLKDGYLPFIQLKGNPNYNRNENLETSDILGVDGKYYTHYQDKDGNILDTRVELTLTMTDFELIKEHYELVDYEVLSGCYFTARVGIFDEYIDKFKKTKIESEGAVRELAKLFLNNLYGKMASNTDSSFKVAYVKDNGVIGFKAVQENDKRGGYIPIGSAITSYARDFTIRAAQQNYYGKDKRGFIYADTDSIHCNLNADELKGIKVHKTEFCCWDLESTWDIGYFVRQKTYIEHVFEKGLKPCEPFYNIKCAGMPQKCKDLFELSMQNVSRETLENYNVDEQEFLKTKREIQDFNVGLIVPSKLRPKRILGGVLLEETTYQMR